MPRRTDRTVPTVALAAAALILGACGDATGPESDLSAEQAEKVARAVATQSFNRDFTTTSSAVREPTVGKQAIRASIAASTTFDFSLQSSCPGGGSVSWSGEAVRSTSGDSLSLDGALAFSECTRTVEESTVTITTTPEFTLTATLIRPSSSEIDWTSQLSGSFDWTLDGESGSCQLDLTTSVTATGLDSTSTGSVDASTTGRICGHDVERSFSLQGSSS